MRRLVLSSPWLAVAAIAAPAAAQVRAVPAQPASEQAALRGVEVFLVNEGSTPASEPGPREIEVTAADGTRLKLERAPGPVPVIAPGGFAKARYVPVSLVRVVPPADAHPPAPIPPGEVRVADDRGSASGFLDRFAPHEPVYAAAGAGTAGAKLQFSFAFRPFAEDAPLKLGALRVAYTQTMFWAIDRPSAPFVATIYSPEVYAQSALDDTATVALGYRHDSNGGDPEHSVDLNRLFIRLGKRFDLGDDWQLDLVPQAWVNVATVAAARDVVDYYGQAGLGLAIGRRDGLKLALNTRGNFRTRRASAEAFASYPLARIGGAGFYLFGQVFTGYGEALEDYRRNQTRARLGIALTR